MGKRPPNHCTDVGLFSFSLLSCSVNSLVLVPAQVMTRDDSSGGWVPMGGGGLSKVSVRKRMVPSEEDNKHEYLIFGKRISDQMVSEALRK